MTFSPADKDHSELLLQRFRESSDGPAKLSLGLELAGELSNQGSYPKAIEVLMQILPLASVEEDRVLVLQLMGRYHLRLSQYDLAYQYLGEALNRLSAKPNTLELFQVYYDMAWMSFRQGLLDNARTYGDGARLVLDELEGQAEIGSQRSQLLHLSALIETAAGNHDVAVASLKQEIEYLKNTGDDHRLAASYNKLASIRYTQGAIAEALSLQEKTHELSVRTNDAFRIALSHKNYGDLHYLLGDLALSREHYEKSLEFCRSINNGLGQAFAQTGMAKIFCCLGETAQGKDHLDQALDLARKLGNKDREVCALVDLAELACRQGKASQALKSLELAAQLDRDRGQTASPRRRIVEARVLMSDESLAGAGKALEVLKELLASPIMMDDEEMASIPELEAEAYQLTARAEKRRARQSEADTAIDKAVKIIEDMAGRLPEELRRQYLAKPSVAEIFDLREQLKSG